MLVLDHVSPATRLLQKRRQMFEVQEVLDQQKTGFDRKEEIFKRQEDGLKKKDLDLQESLIKFSKFLQENDSKINRAEKKCREEITLRQQKELEICELENVLDALKEKCDEVNEVVEKHIKYQRYLESVVEQDSDLQETAELLNRHATLVNTNTDLKQQQKQNNEEMERVRAEMNAMIKRKTDEILNKNNHIARLKKHLETIRLKAADQEAIKDSSLQVTSQNTLEYGQVCARSCFAAV
jgi:chromosome segregation ATPase